MFASNLPRVDDEREGPLLKDRRVQGLIAAGVLAGFLAGLLIFGSPWHLPPSWGDIPTWLLVVLAAAASWVGFAQLGALRQQMAEDALRNIKRDKLMDKQLDEAERRAESDRRRLVEDVNVLFNGKTGDVVNNSKRPLTDITCKVVSKVDRHVLATPDMWTRHLHGRGLSNGMVPMVQVESRDIRAVRPRQGTRHRSRGWGRHPGL